MFRFEKEPEVYEIGGVKLGGQPGQYPTVACFSIFQESDRLFDKGARRKGFNEKRAEEMLKTADKFREETGVPPMADIVASPGEKFNKYVDFVTSVSDMPFCVDAIQMKTKLDGAAYCAEKGLLDRMFYNSITVWEEDLETEIKEMVQIGVKHVLLVAFDPKLPCAHVSKACGLQFDLVVYCVRLWGFLTISRAYRKYGAEQEKDGSGSHCVFPPSLPSTQPIGRFVFL